MTRPTIGRVDFHIHSYASNVTDYYAANTFAIPESYSDPIETYHELKRQGMSLVTLTDHNSIDGVLEILAAGHRDVFISAEMTTTFPEDGCNIHVTIANMSEAQFQEADRLRGNIYEMIGYIENEIAKETDDPASNKLVYFMTHPLMSTQNREYGRRGSLTVDHLEKALLLCPVMEIQNGTRTKSLNDFTLRWIESIDQKKLERLANKHGIEPNGETPWLKGYTAGSDDHSGINQGRTWTTFPFDGDAPTPNMLVEAIRRRETKAGGAHGGPVTLAHSVFKLLYDGQAQNTDESQKSVKMSGTINDLLRFAFGSSNLRWHERWGMRQRYLRARLGERVARMRDSERSFEQVLTKEAYALLGQKEFRSRLASTDQTDDKIFLIISQLLNRMFVHYVSRIRKGESLDLVRTIKELVALITSNVFVSLPYFMSYVAQSCDKLVTRDVRKRFDLHERDKLVLVTDTLFDVNGVAKTIWKILDESERRGIDLTVVSCLSQEELRERCADPQVEALLESGRLKIFPSVYNVDFPEYEGLEIRFPPLLEMLKYAQERGFTKMQISTPGIIGLAGLFSAKLLQIETSATYHTSFPEYVENYTKDISLEAFTWKYMILFYHSVDEVVVPSKFIAKLLHKRGLRNRKLLILDRWVDLDRFHPRHRTAGFWRKFGLQNEDDLVKFVYVGRVGREKNLDTCAEAFQRLAAQDSKAHLVIVGDGPYRDELEEMLSGYPVTFTGFLGGEELQRALASADVKLFPSTTDTWGNAPLEAQASGIPVVVSDQGGPQELMRDGVTGFRIPGHNVDALADAMFDLMDESTRREMGTAARQFAEEQRIDEPFTAILDSDGYRRRARKEREERQLEELRPVIVTPHREELVELDFEMPMETVEQ